MLEKAKPIASGLLEAAESDIAYENGSFLVVGTTAACRCLRSRRT